MLVNNPEIFKSMEGTEYKWEREQEKIIVLSDDEVKLLHFKVNLMSDEEILNRVSGNGVPMGIPIKLSDDRLNEIKAKLVTVLKDDELFIDVENHVLDRLVWDSLLEDGHPDKRGWETQEEIEECIYNVKKVHGIRLNVNHEHPQNTESLKHLHPHLALVISGRKKDGSGRLVLVVLNKNQISVITIL
ncbi:hypothetical protein ACFVS2_21645 [Brevibacillus sp. NPDC058079]|uniref:hypothetical protein n=1 Tax=Brevibacillus sp. NPDC058079 TaxID=3346330 RepID=UPI0036F1799E